MITLTDSAAVKVKELLEAEGATDMALRVAVRPGGCSGYSYEMFFDSDITAEDVALTGIEETAGSPNSVNYTFTIYGPLSIDGTAVITSR